MIKVNRFDMSTYRSQKQSNYFLNFHLLYQSLHGTEILAICVRLFFVSYECLHIYLLLIRFFRQV